LKRLVQNKQIGEQMRLVNPLALFLSPLAIRRVQFGVAASATVLAFGFAAAVVFAL
jgi:hypothetical protein